MKKIGLFLDFPPQGGGVFQYAQSVLAALAALPAVEYRVVVAHTHPAWQKKLDGYTAPSLSQRPLRTRIGTDLVKTAVRFGFPPRGWRFAARHFHPLTRQLCAESCDLWIFPAQDVWTYTMPVPAVGVIHDLMHRYERRFPEVSRAGLYHRRELHYQRLCAFSRGILVDSEVGKRQVIESYGVPQERLHVLPYVAPPYMKVRQETDFERRYRLPERFFFYPAQFWEHKNHARLLQAFARIAASVSGLDLVLVGSKKNGYSRAMSLIRDLGLSHRVHVLGYVPDEDMPGFYRRARALVMPTFFGPTNIPPLEAMAVGCPMAISNVYAMPEQAGDAALVFDPASVDGIAAALYRLATDDGLCRCLAEAGRARARLWTQAHFNRRLRSILESVLAL